MTSEVKKTPKETKSKKAPGIDILTNNVMILGGEESVKQIVFFMILETKKIPVVWKEAKMITHAKQRHKRHYSLISLFSHMYKLFTRLLRKRVERILDETQPREQNGFRKKGYSTVDPL